MPMPRWELPPYRSLSFGPKRHAYCLGIPVRDEGARFLQQLQRLNAMSPALDVVVADSGRGEGACEAKQLQALGVGTLLINLSEEGLGSQLRLLLGHALAEGYEGCVLMDGNGKDDVAALPDFLARLSQGLDFVQGSRFLPGGRALHTPWHRLVAIRLIHAPILSLAARFPYTDTTNGFRAFSARFLLDERVAPFRACFSGYELHYYLALKAARLGYRVAECPVTRSYPAHGPTPTKIHGWFGYLTVMRALLETVGGRFDPHAWQV